MKISIYDENLVRVAIVGNLYVSCFWQEKYNDIGRFTLELQETDELKTKIKPDYFVKRNDRDTIMIIKSVEVKDQKIVASGFEATRILDDIVRTGSTLPAGRVIPLTVKIIYEQSSATRDIYEIPYSEISVTSSSAIGDDSLLNVLRTMCQSSDLGFRSIKNENKIQLVFYKPEKKENVVFSERFRNLGNESILQSSELYKNYAVVLGRDLGLLRKRIDVDMSNGGEKYQIIVDASDEPYDEDSVSESEYEEKLYSRGIKELVGKTKIWNCSFTPMTEDFGKVYDIGDIITVYLNKYNVRLEARVVSFQQVAQNNDTNTTIEVGNLIISKR